ncbi:MAG: hypothetical protein WBV84_03520 [Nitrososphaeraceae archaeon]
MEESRYSRLNKNSFSENSKTVPNDTKRPFKVQALWGIHFIILDDALHTQENEWYEDVRQPNGDVLLKKRILTH